MIRRARAVANNLYLETANDVSISQRSETHTAAFEYRRGFKARLLPDSAGRRTLTPRASAALDRRTISHATPIKINGIVSAISTQPMDVETVRRIAYELMTKDQAREFENEMEMNLSYLDRSVGNFRINIFRQRGTISLCIRYVRSRVPPFEDLKLPSVLLNLVMETRGLVLVVGAGAIAVPPSLVLAPGQSVTLRAGDELVPGAALRLRFEADKRVPGAPASGTAARAAGGRRRDPGAGT